MPCQGREQGGQGAPDAPRGHAQDSAHMVYRNYGHHVANCTGFIDCAFCFSEREASIFKGCPMKLHRFRRTRTVALLSVANTASDLHSP